MSSTGPNGIPLDAGASLLGVYGLRNPMIVWLLNKRPDLLAETPKELYEHNAKGEPPICGEWSHALTRDGEVDPGIVYRCGRRMEWRYIDNRPAWVCYAHGSEGERVPLIRFVERPPAKLNSTPDFDLWAELGAALEGQISDLVFDRGEWRIRHI